MLSQSRVVYYFLITFEPFPGRTADSDMAMSLTTTGSWLSFVKPRTAVQSPGNTMKMILTAKASTTYMLGGLADAQTRVKRWKNISRQYQNNVSGCKQPAMSQHRICPTCQIHAAGQGIQRSFQRKQPFGIRNAYEHVQLLSC